MPYPLREKIGMWVQKFRILHPFVLRYEGQTPRGGKMYVNRISRHLVTK